MIHLPPIRQLLQPAPGFVFIDADLDRADAQVVAWEADEPDLKAVFRSGLDVHIENAKIVYPPPITSEHRQRAKNGIHLTNYGGKARTLASTLNSTIRDAELFQQKWFAKYPGIHRWHLRTDNNLRLKRSVTNIWGFRRFYFDRADSPTLLSQALAWIGQSTVAITINKGMKALDCAEDIFGRERCGICLNCLEPGSLQLLLQNHDSLLMQVPEGLCPGIFYKIKSALEIEIPFDDPLVIPISLKYSRRNWGLMTKWLPGEELKDAA